MFTGATGCRKGSPAAGSESALTNQLTRPLTEQLVPGRQWAKPDYCGKPSLRGPLARWEIRDRFNVKVMEIVPNLYPESFGQYQLSSRSYNPLNLKGQKEFSQMDSRWMVRNRKYQFFRHDAFNDNSYAFSEATAEGGMDLGKSQLRMNAGASSAGDVKMGRMIHDGSWRISYEYSVVRQDISLAAPPKINDLVYARISADCRQKESKAVILALEPARILRPKVAGFVEAEGYIDPVIAGRDPDCVVGTAVYNDRDELYGMITSYDPNSPEFVPNYRITSVYDIRLKQLLEGYFKPGTIDFGRQKKERVEIGLSDTFYQTLCDDKKLRSTALQMLTSEQLKKSGTDVSAAYQKNIEDLMAMRELERKRRKAKNLYDNVCFLGDDSYFELDAILKKMNPESKGSF